jgi:hypothetical protein
MGKAGTPVLIPPRRDQNRLVGSRGSRGDTQRKPCGVAREALTDAVQAATGGYKGTKFHSLCKGVGVARITVWISKQHNFGRGKGQCFHRVSEGGKDRRLPLRLETPERFGNFRGNYARRPSRDCESRWKKMIGKSRHGGRKLNVRLCVQRRLACSAGVSPAGVKARSPVAGMAERRETQYLKPIDKAIL